MHYFLRALFLLPLLAFTAAANAPESGAISSSSASYDGNALILTGQVALDHGLGKMRADEAVLQKQESGKEFPFSTIALKKGIQIELKDHARLHCDRAELDFTALRGKLLAAGKEKVVYTDQLKRGGRGENSLRLISDVVDLTFEKVPQGEQRSDFLVHEILATGAVVIDFAEALTLQAGKAIYKKGGENILRALPTDTFSTCDIQRGGDRINADSIEIDVNRKILFLKNPKGLLFSALPRAQKGEVRFQCDRMVWDHPQNTLHLQGNAHVDEASFGTLEVDRELALVQKERDGHKMIASLQSEGKSVLQFQDAGRKGIHRLICHGQVKLDHEKMHATFESPIKDNTVAKEDQLYYEEGQIAVYADRGMIDYSVQDDRLSPSAISLKGNVRILSHNAAEAPRYGIADWVTYSPTTRTFILSAHPGSRVLFWDGKENLRISAQEIHLTQDGSHQTESVKGVGKVQFSFTADEEALLQKVFGLTLTKQ